MISVQGLGMLRGHVLESYGLGIPVWDPAPTQPSPNLTKP